MSERPVVGEQMSELITLISEKYASRSFAMLELCAPSGTGKSRTVREFYHSLVANQTQPPYWPRLQTDSPKSQSPDPLPYRKVLGPSQVRFEAPPGAIPDFLWLTVAGAQRGDGHPTECLQQLAHQLDLHSLALLAASLRDVRATNRAQEWITDLARGLAGDLPDESYSTALSAIIEQVAGAALPGSGVVLNRARRQIERIRRNSLARGSAAAGFVTAVDMDGLVGQVVEDLAEVARAGTPLIIAIEDAHLMDSSLASLLIALRIRNVPTLVLTTTWPEAADRDVYSGLRSDMAEAAALVQVDIAELSPLDLAKFVTRDFPNTRTQVIEYIVARFRTPLTLELFLSLDMIRGRAVDGGLDLTHEQIQQISPSHERLYEARWQELDREVQEALLLAMAVTGAQGFDGGTRFGREVIVELAGQGKDRSVRQGFSDAADRDHWIAELLEGVDGYREPLLAQLVLGKLPTRYFTDDVEALRDLTISVLGRHLRAVDPLHHVQPADDLVAQWFLSIDRSNDNGPLQGETAMLAVFVHARSQMQAADYEAARSALASLDWAAQPPEVSLVGRQLLFEACIGAGQRADGVAIGAALASELDSTFGPLDERVVEVRMQLGHWLRSLGRHKQALSELRRLAGSLEQGSDAPSAALLQVRSDISATLGYTGFPDKAEEQLADVAEDCLKHLGATHVVTLSTRRKRWRWAGASGRLITASSGLAEVHTEMVEALGGDHPETLFALSNLAYFEAQAGEQRRALSHYEEVLSRRRRVLGPAHHHTVDTLRNMARVTAQIEGHVTPMVDAFANLLERDLKILSATDPLVLATRFDLVCALADAGRIASADEELRGIAELVGELRTAQALMATIGEYGMLGNTRTRLEALRTALFAGGSLELELVDQWLRACRVR